MEQRRNGRTLSFTCNYHILSSCFSNGTAGISYNSTSVDCKIWRMHVSAMVLYEEMERPV